MSHFPPPQGMYQNNSRNENRRSRWGNPNREDRDHNNNRRTRFEPYNSHGRYNRNNNDHRRRRRDDNTLTEEQINYKIQKETFESMQRKKEFQTQSRWHSDTSQFSHVVPPFPVFVPYGMPDKAFEAFMIRSRIDEITRRLQIGLQVDNAEMREPSPEPVFDKHGRRTNSRIQRVRRKLVEERRILVERALEICPVFKPPPDFKHEVKKYQKKLPIPIEKYPDYNFIGLIIGPRGATQKKLENETNSKIAIRGKGSVKGMKGKILPGQDEPLHVLVTAENEKTLQKAVEVIEKLLIPVEEGKNEFKRQQLRELARIHGTLRDDNLVDPPKKDESVVNQLQDYGKANPQRNQMTEEGEGMDDDEYGVFEENGQVMGPRDVGHGRGMKSRVKEFMGVKFSSDNGEDENDELFNLFVEELEGKAQHQPFYQYYNFVQKPKRIRAPGLKGIPKGHYLYLEQKTKEDEEIFDENDEDYFCVFLDNPVPPPGTTEEETHELIMEQKRMIDQQKQFLGKLADLSNETEEKKEKKELENVKDLLKVIKKKKKKKEELKKDLPPWEIESDSDDEED